MRGSLAILLCFFSFWVSSQIRIEVTQLPPLLVKEGKLYIVGSFNNWNPGDPQYALQRSSNGHYWIDLPDNLDSFEYKFTQGNWVLTEGSGIGGIRSNRRYDKVTERNPKYVEAVIEGWEKKPGYTFVVKVIPPNTPADGSIYLAGNFNNWNPADPAYKFLKQIDGTYRLLFYTDIQNLEFKFTRGSWDAVESKVNGKVRTNRKTTREHIKENPNRLMEFDVLGWEDLTGTFHIYTLYDLLLIFAVLQGILFLIAIPSIQDYNRSANFWLILLMALSSLMILFKVVGSYRELAQAFPKALLIPDFIQFLYAPVFYFYVSRLLFQIKDMPARWYLHFIPATLHFFLYLPCFLMDNKTFSLKIVNNDLDIRLLFLIVGAVGLVFNAFYWWQSFKAIKVYKEQYMTRFSYEQNLQYLSSVQFIQAFCLIFWLFGYVLMMFGYLFTWDVEDIVSKNVDAIWLIFSTVIYFLGYVAIRQPEVFKVPQPDSLFENVAPPPVVVAIEETAQKEIEVEKQIDENIQIFKEKIEVYMLKNKPYANPNLSLNELAMKLKMQPHILSKVINQGFQKNFFDFINNYRVEEFKLRMDDPKYRHYTLISVAYEVGFNSKTAFNRSFKKMTNQTPSEYYNLHKEY
jgi:AraC-like DNA-binding protein